MNRTGEMPSSLYNTPSMAPTRYSHQNLMDSNPEPHKQMGNNVGGMGMGQGAGLRNSMGPDPHNPGLASSHSQPHAYGGGIESGHDPRERGRETLRRGQAPPSMNRTNPSPQYNYQQAMSDHFDHYKRPPSRDSSMDRYNSRTRSRTRGQTPEIGPNPNPHSRASSRQRTPLMEQPQQQQQQQQGQYPPQQSTMRSSNINLEAMMANLETGSMRRGETPGRTSGKDSPIGGIPFSETGSGLSGSGPIDEMILRQRGLGQEIPPSLYTPKRTESLFLKSAVPGKPPPPLISPSKVRALPS
jgi:hypothetical protein